MAKLPAQPKRVKSLSHEANTRPNNPTAELEGLMRDEEANPIKVDYERRNNPDVTPELYERNEDMDPQLVWLGKDEEDREPLSVDALPIYVQEHIHPKVIVENLKQRSKKTREDVGEDTFDLFADWAGELKPEDRVEFYNHQQRWTNRMILGDSLSVMTSLAEKEGMKGKVQCIFMDPPYGIKFSSNWQTSTKSRAVSEGDISREPETIKAFRDTWKWGINSYLSYLRDRLTVARDLLTDSGSIFLQIGDENVHLVRSLMDEVFGSENAFAIICFKKKNFTPIGHSVNDYVLWYAKVKSSSKINPLHLRHTSGTQRPEDKMFKLLRYGDGHVEEAPEDLQDTADYHSPVTWARTQDRVVSQHYSPTRTIAFSYKGKHLHPGDDKHWSLDPEMGMRRLDYANRLVLRQKGNGLDAIVLWSDVPRKKITNFWEDTGGASNPIYVVQTSDKVIQRCILMTTDPGDVVLDPTCGSGTTAYVAEQWGRRWITTDTSRVSITLARSRLMGAQFDYYLLNDSDEGAKKEMAVSGNDITRETYGHNVSNGFVLERVPHVTLGSIANNTEIDTIWDKWQEILEPLRQELNAATGQTYEEWEIPREAKDSWPDNVTTTHTQWQNTCIKRQQEIDASIARNASTEYLHDKPYKQSGVVRVTGPFTVESLSPHRVVPSDVDDEAIIAALCEDGDLEVEPTSRRLRPASMEDGETKFHDVIFENLRKASVQNTKKGEDLKFISLEPWPKGRYIQFEGVYEENGKEKKSAICIGPEYGTVSRSLMVQAAREAADYFDLLIVMGFAFEAFADEDHLNIGKMRVLKTRLNSDLHMADKLKTGGSGNLFVVFGEPDIELRPLDDGMQEVEILGVDIFDPTTGEVKSSGPEDIACWFIDTDYSGDAFFVRHAYFCGGGVDTYKKLKKTLKAEIDEDAWETLYATTSRPFPKPESRRIAVKAINHYGDEVLRVFDV